VNSVLAEILRTKTVTDGVNVFPLHSEMSESEGLIIAESITTVRPLTSLEVGFAYGVSTLYACDAIAENKLPTRHIVIDPFQDQWNRIGLKNVARAGYGGTVCLIEEKSEIALPRLLSDGTRIQFAIVDGWHTFDHALVDFFYINKMLDVDGIVVLDDTDMPSLKRLAGHIDTYPAYRRFLENAPPTGRVPARTRIRRFLASHGLRSLKPDPSCVAFRKIAPDERNWDWHGAF
jgi:predicted O-methyltransferase YrrM